MERSDACDTLANPGDDSDATACVAGTLAGAMRGLDGIPSQ